MGSCPGNCLLCENRVRLRTIHQMVGPLPVPCVCGSFSAPGCPLPFTVSEAKITVVATKVSIYVIVSTGTGAIF